MSRRAALRVLDGAIPLGFGAVIFSVAPLRTALQFGADEGYELMKALLVSRGHALYGRFWNDQPPLHTEMVALLFRLFGPSAYVARLLSVGLAMLLVGALYRLVSVRSGRVAGLVAVGLLMAAPEFLQLSVSVMLEMPAMAAGVAAVWAWVEYCRNRRKGWLVGSGILFGCALQVKLTAAIFGPALAVDMLVMRRGLRREERWAAAAREGLVWAGVAAGTFGLIAILFYGRETMAVFWRSHFSAGTRQAAAGPGYGFHLITLWNDFVPVWPAAVAGLGWIGWRRRWDLLLPVALLGTALVAHEAERPYWSYYVLHFAVPLAWLGALGIVEWFRVLWRQGIPARWLAKLGVGLGVLGWSLAVSAALTMLPPAVWSQMQGVEAAMPAQGDAMVQGLRREGAGKEWVFTEHRIEAFWAGLAVPPPLAVIPSKRIWSGQIDGGAVRAALERYRPGVILLDADEVRQFGLGDYLRRYYRAASEGGVFGLYVRRDEAEAPGGPGGASQRRQRRQSEDKGN
jgi:4-amino-4-deoxy-L-arabinose transferase-like glycosyltransferase